MQKLVAIIELIDQVVLMVRPPAILQSIHAELRQKVLSGHFAEGDRLPTTNELAKEYDCSVGMAGKAIAMLVHEGLVEQRRGLGTRVIRHVPVATAASVELDAFAFIYPSDRHEGISRTMNGFQDAARDHKRRVITLSTGIDFSKEAEFIARLAEFDVQGAAMCPLVPTAKDQLHLFEGVLKSKFPITLVNFYVPGFDCPSVVMDGFHAGYTVTKHLLERGAERIGFFTNNFASASTFDRYRGYAWAMQEAGLKEQPNSATQNMHPDFADPLREPIEHARIYLENFRGIDSVVCSNDYLAIGMMTAAREAGYHIPGDFKVAGIDDFSVASKGDVSLTTYHSPCEEVGYKSFELVDALVHGRKIEFPELRLQGHLVERGST